VIDVGIVGAGFIGGVHARLIDALDDARLTAVVDRNPEKAALLADPRGARTATTLDDLAADGALPDLVAICTVSAGHADLAIRALELGCHVLVEKPIDITLPAADRLVAAATASDRLVGVVSQRRFLASSAALRAAVDAGHLGALTGATVESPFFRAQSYYDSGEWRGTLAHDGGGALMNQGVHALDLMLWLLGDPVAVSALSACVAHERIDVEDVVGAAVSFASGAVGTAFASTAAFPESSVRLAVFGTAGSATIDDGKLRLRVGEEETVVSDEAPAGWTTIDWAHRAQYADFVDAIRSGRAPAVGVSDGRRALATVLAIYASAASGRREELR
jgi:predicted dehydrogenase